jgi:hypothetical protein
VNWEESTIISNLGDYIFQFDVSTEPFKIETRNYEVVIDEDGRRREENFRRFIKNSIPKFVFSESRQQEMFDNNEYPYDRAMRKLGEITDDKAGIFGEVILFTLMEGELGFPLVSHKLSVIEDYEDEQKGADGLYIGFYDSREFISYGEAKFHEVKSGAVSDAMESIDEFHGSGGMDEREAELDVARGNISQDLEKEQIKRLMNKVLQPGTNLPILHPVLIAYEKGDYKNIKSSCASRDETIDFIEEIHEREEFASLVKRWRDKFPNLQGVRMIFFFLRVEDEDNFKKKLDKML